MELDSSLLGRFSEVDGQRVDIRVAVCIPCYDESWFEIGGTLRSLASSILAWTRSCPVKPLSSALLIP